MTVDLNDVLDDKIVGGLTIHDTEYLKTVFVAVNKSQKEAFEREVYNIGGELVGYGGESDIEKNECRHPNVSPMWHHWAAFASGCIDVISLSSSFFLRVFLLAWKS